MPAVKKRVRPHAARFLLTAELRWALRPPWRQGQAPPRWDGANRRALWLAVEGLRDVLEGTFAGSESEQELSPVSPSTPTAEPVAIRLGSESALL